MTPKQQTEADKFIELHKTGNGKFEWMDYYYINRPDEINMLPYDDDKEERHDYQSLTVIKQYLLDKNLIKYLYDTNDTLTTLTPDGWKWISFDKEQKNEQKEIRKKKIIDFPKLYWLPISVLTYFAGLYTDKLKSMLFDQDNKKGLQEKSIKTKTSNPTDSSALHILDSSSFKK